MLRGRPRKKPNVDTQAEIAEMVDRACELLIEPFDDRKVRDDDLPSMNSVAEEMGITIIKLKRLLITGGFYSSTTSRAVQERVRKGVNMDQICEELNIRPASFYANIPYSKGAYNLDERSLCADQNVRYRERKKAVEALHASISSGSVEEQKTNLWSAICLFAGYPFTTSGRGKVPGSPFKYCVSEPGGAGGRRYEGPEVEGFGNELFIIPGAGEDKGKKRDKGISRSSVDYAFKIAQEGVITGPKSLKIYGSSYVYALFVRFGLITPDE